MRLGVFIDVSNLYYCIHKRYNNRKLDYKKYYDYISNMGEIKQAIAYGAQMKDEARNFIHCLDQIGFQAKYKKPKEFNNRGQIRHKADVDVEIVMDIVKRIDSFDRIVLGCADSDLAPMVEWVQEKGINVIVCATGISHELKETAHTCIEIPESLLETPKNA